MLPSPFHGDLPTRIRASAALEALFALVFLGTALTLEGLLLWGSGAALAGFYGAVACSLGASLLGHGLRFHQAIRKLRYLRRSAPDLALIAMMVAFAGRPSLVAPLGAARALLSLLSLGGATGLGRRAADGLARNPAAATAISFLGAILLGAVLLALPRATIDLQGASLIDALFTSASATCVTGLIVANTAVDAWADPTLATFSPFGQGVILALIQAGGIGIMTLSASATVVLGGGGLSLKGRRLLAGVLDQEGPVSVQAMIGAIVGMTLAFEAIGAAVLTWRLLPLYDGDVARAAWSGTFHAVSAFCNAGFSLFSRNLVPFRDDPVVLGTISLLILAGGAGFAVIGVRASRRTWSGGSRGFLGRLPLHARLALVTSFWLLLAGAVLLLVLDVDGSLADLPWDERLWAAWFQSVSARTAGFNVVEMAATSRAAVVLYLFLMFVGASPGGTGGGIKTTTFALLLLSVRAALRGRGVIEVWGRTIPATVMVKVSVITLTSFAGCFGAAVVLLATQHGIPTEHLLFETVSAFGTAGLSLGATPRLDGLGKLVLTVLMFLGRVGPLTLALALGRSAVVGAVRYPEGRVIVG